MKVVWTPSASSNLEDIADFIARENASAAVRITRRIVASTAQLAAHPYRGKPGRVTDTREFVIARTIYIVAYRVRRGRVEVLAVRHGAREWPEGFPEE